MSDLHEASVARMRALTFGDPVTNVCAGANNPLRHAWFVAYETPVRKNGYGVPMTDHWARCTDKCGAFWRVGIDVVHPGHLDDSAASELFQPVWQKRYGSRP